MKIGDRVTYYQRPSGKWGVAAATKIQAKLVLIKGEWATIELPDGTKKRVYAENLERCKEQ